MGRTCIADHRPDFSLDTSAGWRNGCAQCEIIRLRARVNSLIGLCKTIIGILYDADLVGDIEATE